MRETPIVLLFAIIFGALLGLGSYTFTYARGWSYLTNDPSACANCHIMNEQFSGWLKSSHHNVATCNDCHTPHNLVGKYAVKAINGFNHSWAFTFQNFHEPIQINAMNKRVTEAACRNCHITVTAAVDQHAGGERLACISCHRSVGHLD